MCKFSSGKKFHYVKISLSLLIFQFMLIAVAGCAGNATEQSAEVIIDSTAESSAGSDSLTISPIDGMEMVFVPAGTFVMGLDGGRFDEVPEHEIYLDGFWIDRTEVTNAMYKTCMQAGACTTPAHDKYYPYEQYSDYPVVYVSWEQANKYCAWVGGRLPSEAEWEKAARGTDRRLYPWGDEAPNSNLLNFARENGDIMPVGSFPEGASPYGALDMAGNAWEWVADWYAAHYYPDSPQSNPTGPDEGSYRVCRGGGWIDFKGGVRVVQRASDMCILKDPANASYKYRRHFVDNDLSFRCVMDEIE